MLAVAVPTIRADLGLTTGTAAWVTLLGGRAADLLGRRRMFLTWLGVFLVFSMLGGFATDGWMLVVARFVTGVAAAFMTPAAMSIITISYPEGPRRDRALLVFAGVGAASAAGAMLLFAYGIVRLEHGGDGLTLGALAAGGALVAAFVVIERRAPAPLVRLGIFRAPTSAPSSASSSSSPSTCRSCAAGPPCRPRSHWSSWAATPYWRPPSPRDWCAATATAG